MNNSKLVLKNVKVIFSSFEDNDYGRSITIDATDPKIQEQIKEFYKDNKIGDGVPKFKEYKKNGTVTIQHTLKLNKNGKTAIVSSEGYTKDDVVYGAEISLTANAFKYDFKGKKGVSHSISTIFVVSPGGNANTQADLEAMGVNIPDSQDDSKPVDLSDIPF